MPRLSAHNILRVWEAAEAQHPIDRALTILRLIRPDATREELASYSVASRDASLWELRERIFGHQVDGFAECPECAEKLEFGLQTDDLRGQPFSCPKGAEKPLELTVGEERILFRLPNSLDLAAMVDSRDSQRTQRTLVSRCVLEAYRNGEQYTDYELSDMTVEAIARHMSDSAPQADVVLEMHCPACSHDWQTAFDIGSFLWSEIQAEAGRLLRDVHTLAYAYKWSEQDILSMSPVRRQHYLELIS